MKKLNLNRTWKSFLLLVAQVFALVVMLHLSVDALYAAATGCTVDVSYSTEDGSQVFNQTDYDLLMAGFDQTSGKYENTFYLDMSPRRINPEEIYIPVEQDVYVNFLHERGWHASSLGWMKYEDAMKTSLSWTDFKKNMHPIFNKINDMDSITAEGPGNGILDFADSLANVSALKAYTDPKVPTPFSPLGQDSDSIKPTDMRKYLGRFAGGTRLVFWLASPTSDWRPENYVDWDLVDRDHVFFTSKSLNLDTFTSCTPDGNDPHNRVYQLDVDNPEDATNTCDETTKGLLATEANDRLLANFNLTMSGTYPDPTATPPDNVFTVTRDQKFPHVIVAAPDTAPNKWLLSWEDTFGGGDMDYNDVTFLIERKNGASVTSKSKSPTDVNEFYTAVDFAVYDEIPDCLGNEIDYFVSADDGTNWIKITNWDSIQSFTLQDDGTKTDFSTPYSPLQSGFNYRKARIDFLAQDRVGRKLTWKAEMRSDISDADTNACAPRILGAELTGNTTLPKDISRSSPIMVGNILYSGSFSTPEVGWAEKLPRGHVRASELYDPSDPSTASTPPVTEWEAGKVLYNTLLYNSATIPARKIYFPDITATKTVYNSLTLTKEDTTTATAGDGTTRVYNGTLSPAPVQATSVRIFAGPYEFRDAGSGSLTSNWGRGVINLFTGEFALEFTTAPETTDVFSAEFTSYSEPVNPSMLSLDYADSTDLLLGLDGRLINATDPVYDFNSDGSFSDNDRKFLIDWVRGSGREWQLGAIDHSVPAVIVPPSRSEWYYGASTTAETRSSFDAYASAYSDRRTVLFVGSRDGMLHAFDAGQFRLGDNPDTTTIEENRGYFAWHDHDNNTDTTKVPNYGTGEEVWSFVPANLLPRLKNNYLGRVSEEGDQAFVDASPTLADMRIDIDIDTDFVSSDCVSGELVGPVDSQECVGEWRTILLSAQGNGGDSIVALDVTDPAVPLFMWEYADPELFRSRSSAAVGKIGRLQVNGEEKWAAFFVSGKTYDNSLPPSIYLIDIADGSLIERVYLNAVADDTDAPSGLGGVPSGQPAIVDSDGNGFIDRLYVGTDKGLMYKVNFSDASDAFLTPTSNVIINEDFYDDDAGATINGQPNPVPDDQQWHPIYASPTVVVENGVNSDGSLAPKVRVFFGTGDNPYFDESIDTGTTKYHFFSYVDHAPKGSVDSSLIELDWFYPLDTGQRIFASAFASAGKIYFGTATSETEDPCDGSNEGELYAFDINGANVDNPTRIVTGDIVTTPLVEDEHLFVRTVTGTVMMGGGGFNNQTKVGGVGVTKPLSWREITD